MEFVVLLREASITLKLNYSSIICAISGTIFGTTLRKESVRRVCTLSENRVPGIRAAPLLRATGFAGSVAWRNRACWREREGRIADSKKKGKKKETARSIGSIHLAQTYREAFEMLADRGGSIRPSHCSLRLAIKQLPGHSVRPVDRKANETTVS